uniref:Inositol polyphosphate-5-phosphatase K n=1 Tax=Oncorhynchus kisutch TaxID=8019 RepID=A0A8C7HWP1_ONCKI
DGLHMVTWNVATAEPPGDVTSLLQLDAQPATDLYVIGLQEVNAAPLRFLSDLLVEDSWSHLLMNTLASRGYIKVVCIRALYLCLVFMSDQGPLSLSGIYGNRSDQVRFSLYGHMICFVNCHLTAHMGYALQRVDEFEYILETQDFDLDNTPTVRDTSQVVFWFGDLNFRISDHGMHFLRSSINSGRFNLLWERDQLLTMKKKEPFLQEFEEGPLKFKPTYKFNRNSDTYDTSGKKRKPAWTDRILWRIKPKSPPPEDDEAERASTSTQHSDDGQEEYPIKVLQDTYTCDPSYGVSDHKPVIGIFNLEMRKRCDSALVSVCPEGQWSADQDAVLSYTILEDFMSSTWDWVGLYKVGFKTASDYATFVWVKGELAEVNEVMQVCVNKDDVPLVAGEYVLGYYSYNMQSIVGFSHNFQGLMSFSLIFTIKGIRQSSALHYLVFSFGDLG